MNNKAGDGVFRYRDGIAVAQVVFFSAAVLAALVSAGLVASTIHHDTDNYWAAIFVCESLGVLLIIFLLLEMLERINKVIPVIHRYLFIVPQVITWIDIGISIGGFVAVKQKEHNQLLPTPYSRAGIAILFVIYLWQVGTFVAFWLRRKDFPLLEHRLLMSVAICVPILAIRIVYSLIFIITADMTWNAVKGDSTAYLMMTMLPEVAITAIATVTIFQIPPLGQQQKMETKRMGETESHRGRQNIPLV